MRTVAVTKIGSLRDPDEHARGRHRRRRLPRAAARPRGRPHPRRLRGDLRVRPPPRRGFLRHRRARSASATRSPGVIEALGERAHRNGLRVGDRVAGNFLRFCGTCRPCQEGRQQFCENIQDYNRPGMAETVTWHESQVYRLPDACRLAAGMPPRADLGRGAHRRQDADPRRRPRRDLRRRADRPARPAGHEDVRRDLAHDDRADRRAARDGSPSRRRARDRPGRRGPVRRAPTRSPTAADTTS